MDDQLEAIKVPIDGKLVVHLGWLDDKPVLMTATRDALFVAGYVPRAEMDSALAEVERLKGRHQNALNLIAQDLGIPSHAAWNMDTIEARIAELRSGDDLRAVGRALGIEGSTDRELLLDAIKTLREPGKPAPAPLPDGMPGEWVRLVAAREQAAAERMRENCASVADAFGARQVAVHIRALKP